MNPVIILFLLPFFILLHELEEILMVYPWVKKNSTTMQKRFPKAKRIIRKMKQITRPHFTIIASEELLIVSACTFVSQQTGDLTAWYCCMAAFSVHLIVHIAQFIV